MIKVEEVIPKVVICHSHGCGKVMKRMGLGFYTHEDGSDACKVGAHKTPNADAPEKAICHKCGQAISLIGEFYRHDDVTIRCVNSWPASTIVRRLALEAEVKSREGGNEI